MTLTASHLTSLTALDLRDLLARQASPDDAHWFIVLKDGSIMLEAVHGEYDAKVRQGAFVRFYFYLGSVDDSEAAEASSNEVLNSYINDARQWQAEDRTGYID